MKKIEFKKYLPFILGGLLLVFWKFGKAFVSKLKTSIEVANAIAQTNSAYEKTININGSDVQINLDTIAAQVYYSFFNSKGGKRFNEDEQAAITAIIACPKSEINTLAAVYASRFGKVLKDDLISKLSFKTFPNLDA